MSKFLHQNFSKSFLRQLAQPAELGRERPTIVAATAILLAATSALVASGSYPQALLVRAGTSQHINRPSYLDLCLERPPKLKVNYTCTFSKSALFSSHMINMCWEHCKTLSRGFIAKNSQALSSSCRTNPVSVHVWMSVTNALLLCQGPFSSSRTTSKADSV